MRTFMLATFAVAASAAASLGVALFAQGAPPAAAPSTYKSSAEILAALDKADINSKTGGAITISKGVVVRRRGAGSPQYAIIHPKTSVPRCASNRGTSTNWQSPDTILASA